MQAEVKVSKKDKIEQQAILLFKDKGYSATSMRNLADHLGLEAASLYSHIKSKEEILQKICFNLANDFFRAIVEVDLQNISGIEKLHAAIVAHIKVITKNPDASTVFSNEWKHLSEPHLTKFIAMRTEYENHFLNIIKEGNKNKEFTVQNPKLSVITILSSLNSLQTWYRPEGKMDIETIGEEISAMLLYGIVNTANKQ